MSIKLLYFRMFNTCLKYEDYTKLRFYLEKVSCPLSFLSNFIFEIALILLELFTTIILFYKINNNRLPAEAKKTIVFFVFLLYYENV